MNNRVLQTLIQYRDEGYAVPSPKLLKTPRQIERIRESCLVNIAILDHVAKHIADGITTDDIDRLVREKTLALGGVSATLGYQGFPKSVCVSINNEVCHGIPNPKRRIQPGDIFNVDVSTIYKGYFSDSSRMFSLGKISPKNQRLVQVTKECVDLGIRAVHPWAPLGDMSAAVHEHAVKNGYSVVREIGGHGVGCEFHEDPFVSYVIPRGTGMLMAPGMIFTIEPMVNMGSGNVYRDELDGWTIRTADGKPSAQWESMVLVTEEGCEVLAY